jgi:hypothetical protein
VLTGDDPLNVGNGNTFNPSVLNTTTSTVTVLNIWLYALLLNVTFTVTVPNPLAALRELMTFPDMLAKSAPPTIVYTVRESLVKSLLLPSANLIVTVNRDDVPNEIGERVAGSFARLILDAEVLTSTPTAGESAMRTAPLPVPSVWLHMIHVALSN